MSIFEEYGAFKGWWDCADAQADLSLRCLHTPGNMFSHGAAHMIILLYSFDLPDV